MVNTFHLSEKTKRSQEEFARRDILALTPEEACLMTQEEILRYYKDNNLGVKIERSSEEKRKV